MRVTLVRVKLVKVKLVRVTIVRVTLVRVTLVRVMLMRVMHVRVMLVRVTLLRVMLVRVVLVRVMLVRVVGLYQAKHMVTNGPNIIVLKSSSIRKCFNEEAHTSLSIARDVIVPFGYRNVYNFVTIDVLAKMNGV